jgi:hypothetical protein
MISIADEKIKIIYILMGACLFLSGCMTLSGEDCRVADWKNIGLIDGHLGELPTHINDLQKSCQESGATVDAVSYEEGWRTGLSDYCSPSGGFQAGESGRLYRGICPKEVEPEFIKQYLAGRDALLLRQEHEAAVNDLRHEQKRIDEDRSVVGDVSKVFHLLSGTSATQAEEERVDKTADLLREKQASAPVQTMILSPQIDPVEAAFSAFGGAAGLVAGFGVGHAIQGHYKQDGWQWTAIDSVGLASFLIVGNNCTSDPSAPSEPTLTCGIAVPVVVIGFLTSRVWQAIELWGDTGRKLSPYHQASSMPMLSIASSHNSLGLGATWLW